ncbi:RNA methyltransferase [Marinilabiliaceae bacterium ANBcel2]|nr:RNA methyltransferase [Marinilabiliaceae bacterium ANBcel2]
MRKLKITELNRQSIEEFKKSPKQNIVVILDNIRSMHNVGSIFRTADAFRIKKIYLCGITPTPPHNDIHKTALGAEDAVEWEYLKSGETAIEILKNEGFIIAAVEQTSKSENMQNFTPNNNQKYAIVMGNEVKGVQQSIIDKCDISLEIPQYGTKHSLNVSVAAGVILWEITNKQKPRQL